MVSQAKEAESTEGQGDLQGQSAVQPHKCHLVDKKLKATNNTALPYGLTGWRKRSETTDGGCVSKLSNTLGIVSAFSKTRPNPQVHQDIPPGSNHHKLTGWPLRQMMTHPTASRNRLRDCQLLGVAHIQKGQCYSHGQCPMKPIWSILPAHDVDKLTFNSFANLMPCHLQPGPVIVNSGLRTSYSLRHLME
ncbi:hypothetical protein Baya_11628 [Bagarius yarrelli]|uniref:Uncharacterized protein n=1 Tax=Bagarius yarrelli TaxID=175774 RepID=A0A556V2F8_BAGYA|nr:hypothetical protein Baya_11628 [Bagarius yarrelli]